MALQHSMRVRMTPDQEEETVDEDGDTVKEAAKGGRQLSERRR
jgi:hypothetical protein